MRAFYTILFSIVLILLFGIISIAQIPSQVFNDDDPLIEQPTRESYSHFNSGGNSQPAVITINDYDNFDVGIDNWENQVTADPNNPLWLFFGVNASPQNARGTTNGGLNWYLNNPLYPGGTCCDTWSAYTGNGFLIYGSGVNGQYVYRSSDNGLTWSAGVLSVTGNDRNTLAAEETGTGPYANYVYAAMTPGNFGRSTNAGATWSQTFTASNTLPGCYICVGPNNDTNGGCVIYITNTGTSQARIYNFYRSTNGGANFSQVSTLNVAGYVGTYNTAGRMVINGARTNPHPKIAMDNSNGPYRGRLYLVYATNEPAGNGNKPDIWLQYSTNQGVTWSTRVRVNDNPNPELSDQFFPEIWCEKNTGILYLHWYDDRSAPATYGTDIYASYTTDGGVTFAPNQRITNATWLYPNPPCPANTNCYRGDYSGITANVLTSFSIWGDPRNGTALNMGAYFPDFAMRVLPAARTINGINDSSFHYVSIPGVKLWNKVAKFSASVSPTPVAGVISLTLLNKSSNVPKDSLNIFPDSLRLRINTSGGVTEGPYTITVKGNGANGTPVHVRTINLTVSNMVGISELHENFKYELIQNYPNPFNPKTIINYQLSMFNYVSLKVYDILGVEVATLVNEKKSAGSYSVEWDATNYPSGIYFYKLTTENFSDVKKMTLLK